MTATLTDQAAYDAYLANDRKGRATARELGIAQSSLRGMIKRHEARLAQDDATDPQPEAHEDAPAAHTVIDGSQGDQDVPETDDDETPAPAKARGDGKADGRFPEGVVTPVAFYHLIVDEGLAPAKFSTQQVYNWVKTSPTFPASHYTADGTAYDEQQTGDDGKATTKPGVNAEQGRAWITNRPARQPRAPKRLTPKQIAEAFHALDADDQAEVGRLLAESE